MHISIPAVHTSNLNTLHTYLCCAQCPPGGPRSFRTPEWWRVWWAPSPRALTLAADDAAIEANHAETAAEEARAAAHRAATCAEAARLTVCPTDLLNSGLILYIQNDMEE